MNITATTENNRARVDVKVGAKTITVGSFTAIDLHRLVQELDRDIDYLAEVACEMERKQATWNRT